MNQESVRLSSASSSRNIKSDDLKEKRAKSVRKALVDQNNLTSLRNKVQEDSKKLKHEVAHQIMASSSIRTSAVNAMKKS